MIDWLNGKIVEVTDLVRGASVLGAIVMVAAAYYKLRSIVALIVAALTAGVFLFAINNIQWFQDRVTEETQSQEIWHRLDEFQEAVYAELDPVFAELREGTEEADTAEEAEGTGR
jgi:hypothetical protein